MSSDHLPHEKTNGVRTATSERCRWRDADEDVVEPIAVIGFSLKFPQDATSTEAFWEMLAERRSAMTEFPAERLNIDAFHHPTRRDGIPVRGGHFIRASLNTFDAEFFGISPSEVIAMDPAQRILLETAFRAIENAGLRIEDLKDSDTSVHTGCFTNDYLQMLLRDPERLPTYAAVGATLSMLANRLSWFLDLSGPSSNIDSACSSSAMAVDQACQLLQLKKSRIGIAAGVNLTYDPDYTNVLTNMQFLSKDSRSYAFDQRANGYSRGEGVGVVILKLLSNALKDGDTIRAVIRASESNQDGRTPSITQPSSSAQIQLIRKTYANAGLTMAHTRYFEAHGTGTPVGDAAEANTITRTFQRYRSPTDPIYVGAVKSNIGHLEGAAGIAGLIKTVMVLERGMIPPNANFEHVSKRIDIEDSCLAFPTDCVEWPSSSVSIRRASINSFGYGGSNCHIVVDDAFSFLSLRGLKGNHRTAVKEYLLRECCIEAHHNLTNGLAVKAVPPETPRLLVWSAADKVSLQTAIQQWQTYCTATCARVGYDSLINDVAYTLDSRRSRLAWKSYSVVSSKPDLERVAALGSAPVLTKEKEPRLAFVFTGQGAQWYAMGRELLQYHVFTGVMDQAEDYLRRLGCAWSLRGELLRSEHESRIDAPEIAQPATAILQIGLVDLLKSAGVTPQAVVGHSMGEIAAAYAAGAITREAAFRLAYFRGKYVAKVPERSTEKGGMLAVGLSQIDTESYLKRIRAKVECFNLIVSCVNSPVNVTVSGKVSELDILVEALSADGVFNRRLRVSAAYHSAQLECIVQDCKDSFGALQVGSPKSRLAMISTVSGKKVPHRQLLDADYWVTNMISPVLFWQAIENLCAQSHKALIKKLDRSHESATVVDHIVEIGPHSALRMPITDTLKSVPRGAEITYDSVLQRKKPASLTFLQLLGKLHCLGYPVALRKMNEPDQSEQPRLCLTDAPEYPFNHSKQYWYESYLSRNYRLRRHGHVELLGSPVRDWTPLAAKWRCRVRPSEIQWLADHKISGKIVYPAAAVMAMAVEAASQLADEQRPIRAFMLRHIRFQAALMVAMNSDDLETRLCLRPLKTPATIQTSRWEFTLLSILDDRWTEHSAGIVEVEYTSEQTKETGARFTHYVREYEKMARCCHMSLNGPQIYRAWKRQGLHYGPSFQGIENASHDASSHALASINLQKPNIEGNPIQELEFHPASLDSIMQVALVALSKGVLRDTPTQVITSIDKVWIAKDGLTPDGRSVVVPARINAQCPRTTTSSMFALSNNQKSVCLVVENLQTSTVATSRKPRKALEYVSSVATAVDVEMLDPQEILAWLKSECGPDVIGPQDFCRELDEFLEATLRELHADMDVTSILPGNAHWSKYLQWVDFTLGSRKDLKGGSLTDGKLALRIRNQGAVGRFFTEVAEHLAYILKGEVDLVQLLFESGLAQDFYEQQSYGSVYYNKLETFVSHLAFKRPSMRILEVGAGTGSFTRHMLRGLCLRDNKKGAACDQYVFTDVSPAFFEQARNELSGYANKVVFQTLNIEKDFPTQGCAEDSFDIVVASNVVHVAENLGATLRRIKRLLKPGGKLILHENTTPEKLSTGFVFGLFPDWWNGAESYRSMSPCIKESQWEELFVESGFSESDLTLHDYADEDSRTMSIMCTHTIDQEESRKASPPFTIIVEQGSGVQYRLAEQTRNRLAEHGYPTSQIVTLIEASTMDPGETLLILLIDFNSAFFMKMTGDTYTALKLLMLSARKALWVTGGASEDADPGHGLIDGYARVLRIENVQLRLAILSLENFQTSSEISATKTVQAVDHLLKNSDSTSVEDYVVIDNHMNIRRIFEHSELSSTASELVSGMTRSRLSLAESPPFSIQIASPGDFDTVEIVESTSRGTSPNADKNEVAVGAIGLDAMDSAVISGTTSGSDLGYEGAGVVISCNNGSSFNAGDRVCFFSPEPFSSIARPARNMVAKIPDDLSTTDAATLPRDLLLANYLIRHRARCRPGDAVLINDAESPLGISLLCVALSCEAKVFAVTKKVDLLQTKFQGRVQVLNSIEHMKAVEPRGVDIVFDQSMTPETMDLFECVAPHGQLIHVNTSNREVPDSVCLRGFRSNLTFSSIVPSAALRDEVDFTKESLQDLLDVLVSIGSLRPPKPRVFGLPELRESFTALTHLENGEKLVIEFRQDDEITISRRIQSAPIFRQDATYLIAGGFGDLGQSVAKWMVKKGARNLILLSRSGPRNDSSRKLMRELTETGVTVEAPACDITSLSDLKEALKSCLAKMPAIKGCIQAAGSLKDTMYEKMSWQDWNAAFSPKVHGSWNLHRALPSGLDFFIMTASISGILGQATQINYAAGNTYQDALARYRIASGEKAISLDLGPLLTGGMLAQKPELLERLSQNEHFVSISEGELLALLDYFCAPCRNLTDVSHAQIIVGIRSPSDLVSQGAELLTAMKTPFWSQMNAKKASPAEVSAQAADEGIGTCALLAAAADSSTEVGSIATSAILQHFASMMSITEGQMNAEEPFHTYGADSLSAIELRNWIMKVFSVDVPVFDLLGETTIAAIGQQIAQRWLKKVHISEKA